MIAFVAPLPHHADGRYIDVTLTRLVATVSALNIKLSLFSHVGLTLASMWVVWQEEYASSFSSSFSSSPTLPLSPPPPLLSLSLAAAVGYKLFQVYKVWGSAVLMLRFQRPEFIGFIPSSWVFVHLFLDWPMCLMPVRSPNIGTAVVLQFHVATPNMVKWSIWIVDCWPQYNMLCIGHVWCRIRFQNACA